MDAQYIWKAGTPVMLLGIEGTYPSESSLKNLWKTVMAGRLEEDFQPGSPVILENAPMPGAIPARGWNTRVVHRLHEQGTSSPDFSFERHEQFIHASWKNMFLISADKGTESLRGCHGFFMVRSSEEVASFIGAGKASLCDRLDVIENSFPVLLELIPEIVASMDWFLGGYHDWHASKIDRSGKIIDPR